ncbi:DUF3306 domain-containing protein [Thiohalocapsa sp.]|uniref:DUF3306 domain-containing protein n=1 Tax=Thiohalocapsa sp. TaxID=2497641 RepID=UPI0025F67A45|nr:DUF3306 domain-containing protein [Thiohalocapsa sp.]
MTTDEKDFLSRWARRKQAARDGLAEPEPEQAAVPAENAAPEPPAEEAPVDESAFEDVDFDALDYDSDYTRFMEKDVPEIVRRRALRALWRSDPILANVDGLNDYDEDFTDAALVVENLASAYKPGKGYATEEDEAVEETQVAEAEEDAAQEPAPDEPAALAQSEETPIAPEDADGADSGPMSSDDGEASKA